MWKTFNNSERTKLMRNKIILDQIKELTEELDRAKTAEAMDEILEQRSDLIDEYIALAEANGEDTEKAYDKIAEIIKD